MAFNLIRNARMFFTTNVDVNTGVVKATGFTASNTKEIQVLDGLSFSQATGTETVTVNEAGTDPARGQRQFNTSLEPVELTFSTYMRPYFTEGTTSGAALDADDVIDAEEDVLWNAMYAGYINGTDELIATTSRTPAGANTWPASGQGSGAAWYQVNGTGAAAPYSVVSVSKSAKNQLQKFGVIIVLDASSYVIDNCVLDQATIDFGLDAIATIAWTARGSTLRSAAITATSTPVSGAITLSGTIADPVTSTQTTIGATQAAKAKNTTAPFLANKLSSVTLQAYTSSPSYASGGTPSGTSYNLALTGGSITLSNNVTYLTPANLGVVNKPFTYFTGTRAISGTINCYLKTGTNNSADLINTMLANSSSDIEPDFKLVLHIGGSSTSATRVTLNIPAAVLSIPTINTEQVVSQTINFTAQGTGASAFDLEEENEITINYYSANTTV